MEIDETGDLRKTWLDGIEEDMKRFGLS